MSGGIAYVLDFDPVRGVQPRSSSALEELEDDDEQAVRELLAEHVDRTGSPVAARLLDDWAPARFVKVMPHDYKRALADGVGRRHRLPRDRDRGNRGGGLGAPPATVSVSLAAPGAASACPQSRRYARISALPASLPATPDTRQ